MDFEVACGDIQKIRTNIPQGISEAQGKTIPLSIASTDDGFDDEVEIIGAKLHCSNSHVDGITISQALDLCRLKLL